MGKRSLHSKSFEDPPKSLNCWIGSSFQKAILSGLLKRSRHGPIIFTSGLRPWNLGDPCFWQGCRQIVQSYRPDPFSSNRLAAVEETGFPIVLVPGLTLSLSDILSDSQSIQDWLWLSLPGLTLSLSLSLSLAWSISRSCISMCLSKCRICKCRILTVSESTISF